MRQHAALRRDRIPRPHRIDQPQQPARTRHIIGHRIDPNHRIARPQQQPVDHCRRNPHRVIGRMIRLQPRREPSPQTHRRPKPRHHLNLSRHRYSGPAPASACSPPQPSRASVPEPARAASRRSLIRQQPVPKPTHGQMRHRPKRRRIMRVEDQPRDLVLESRESAALQETPPEADPPTPSALPLAPPHSQRPPPPAHPPTARP